MVLIESSNEMFNFSPAYWPSRSQRIAMIDSGLKIGKPRRAGAADAAECIARGDHVDDAGGPGNDEG